MRRAPILSTPIPGASDELRAAGRGGAPAGRRSPSSPGHPLRLKRGLLRDLPLTVEAMALGLLVTVAALVAAELLCAFTTRIPA